VFLLNVPFTVPDFECKYHEEINKMNIEHNKDKAIPLQAWIDPEGSRRLRLPDFKTVGT